MGVVVPHAPSPQAVATKQYKLLDLGQLEAHPHVTERHYPKLLELHVPERARHLDHSVDPPVRDLPARLLNPLPFCGKYRLVVLGQWHPVGGRGWLALGVAELVVPRELVFGLRAGAAVAAHIEVAERGGLRWNGWRGWLGWLAGGWRAGLATGFIDDLQNSPVGLPWAASWGRAGVACTARPLSRPCSPRVRGRSPQ